MANGGTLFLDEIGDMGPKMQAQLLRTLQDGEVRPVGGADVDQGRRAPRVRDQPDLDERGQARASFREDLFFRINVVTISLPPLRDRRERRPDAGGHFLDKLALREQRAPAAMSPEALQAAGRVRAGPATCASSRTPSSARSPSRRATSSCRRTCRPRWTARAVPRRGRRHRRHAGGEIDDRPTLAELERRYIQLVLGEVGGNKKKAAEKLGIDRRTLYRALERSGELPPDAEDDE